MNPNLRFVTRHVLVCRTAEGHESELRRYNYAPRSSELNRIARNIGDGVAVELRHIRIPAHAVFEESAPVGTDKAGFAIL